MTWIASYILVWGAADLSVQDESAHHVTLLQGIIAEWILMMSAMFQPKAQGKGLLLL